MTDRKKTLRGLECCRMNGKGCTQCPYNKECDEMPDFGNAYLCSDALELLKEQQETIASLQGTICKLTKALAEQPEQKFFVDSDGKITPLPIQPQWISVKDRLPEPGMSVIIYGTPKEDPEHTDGKIAITHMSEWNYFNSQIKTEPYWIMPWQYFSFDYTITHWMPLPEPPKEEDT